MFTKTRTIGLNGLNAYPITIEMDISRGMPNFDIIGSVDNVIKESRERIKIAARNIGIELPTRKIIISLTPSSVKKTGSVLDLAMFVALLKTMDILKQDFVNCAFFGELSLDGAINRIKGVLPMVIRAKAEGMTEIFVPFENAFEASVIDGINVYPVRHISELTEHLRGDIHIPKQERYSPTITQKKTNDFCFVMGQQLAKFALEIAAAGGHNVLLIGPPGAGKSMLAKCIPSILPEMTFKESVETTNIHSICDILDKNNPLVTERPFRSPHHSISNVGLIGGGYPIHPGEISMAHNGVLFLDEFPEFNKNILEGLRQPLEDRTVTISRESGSADYPCSFILIAAMNPCPCGYYGTSRCTCSKNAVQKYLSKVSGPMLDRFDMHIVVDAVEYKDLSSKKTEEPSVKIRERVEKARRIQTERFKGTEVSCNAQISDNLRLEFCRLDPSAEKELETFFNTRGISARGYTKILKVARTVADLDNSEFILKKHIIQAIYFRSNNNYWQ
ncbi:MAG: YifB family Mg chelatase-like AAA ATPase [Oscillospiraceae bacterium]|jgi:magnesium chelatase family protein|nr:YifB family Mg chelatase-like AAA ATPase [Oscillospiraceae bacterium]